MKRSWRSVQFIPTTINNLEPTVTGGPLDAVYRLEQIHYHWPSEHAINGHKYPMEIHFVHIRRELDVEAALKEVDGLAILVVFWNLVLGWEQPVLKDEDMPYFANLSVPGTQLKDVILNIGSLIRTNHRSYFTYSGSLSSPECQECVTWIIFETPLLVPENLYRAFGFLGVQRNNYRSTQELNKHRIFRTVNKAIMTPLLADTFADIGTVLTQIVKSYTGKAYNWSGRVAKAAFMAFKPGHDILGRQESGRQPIFDRKDIGDSEEDYPNIKVDTGLDDLEFKPGIEDTDKDDFLNNDEPENGKINGGEPSSKDSHEDADDLHMMDFDNLVRHAKSSK
ncbi:putative carbonic anhydrase 3 [Plodia interpunctella]|uniref:putative carbonic anhydrase 3 n=1 Tax=Plodia interpunctella TaxID=58824 RepID=UPI0031018DD7